MIENQNSEWTKENLRSLRLRLGWTKSDLARRLGCSQDIVASMEDGSLEIDLSAQGDLQVILRHAETCSDEVKHTPACENEMDRSALEQVEFSRVKEDLE
jgi:predicted transcriptional regulator